MNKEKKKVKDIFFKYFIVNIYPTRNTIKKIKNKYERIN